MTDVVALQAADVAGRLEQWRAVYNACFTVPPWNEPAKNAASYAAKVDSCAARPGFTALEARTADGVLAGVGYGWPSGRDLTHPFYKGMQLALPAAESLLAAGAFEIAELMTMPAHRGHGIGRRLLEQLCADRSLCWLATMPNSPAARYYTKLGWASVGIFTANGSPWEAFERRAR